MKAMFHLVSVASRSLSAWLARVLILSTLKAGMVAARQSPSWPGGQVVKLKLVGAIYLLIGWQRNTTYCPPSTYVNVRTDFGGLLMKLYLPRRIIERWLLK